MAGESREEFERDRMGETDDRLAEAAQAREQIEALLNTLENDRRVGILKDLVDWGTLRDLLTAQASAPQFDPSNHHNALACPYCNPNNLTLSAQPPTESQRAIQQHQAAQATERDAPGTMRP